jgi:hypothetical protein
VAVRGGATMQKMGASATMQQMGAIARGGAHKSSLSLVRSPMCVGSVPVRELP